MEGEAVAGADILKVSMRPFGLNRGIPLSQATRAVIDAV
jgi:hypothetical protein